jgi:cytochrome b561
LILYRLHKLALELRPVLPFCYLLGFGGAAFTAYLLFRESAHSSQWLGVALGLTVWALLLFAFIRLFQSIPPPVLPGDSFFERLWSRCKLALYHVLAFGVVIIGVVLLSMSLKLLSIPAG